MRALLTVCLALTLSACGTDDFLTARPPEGETARPPEGETETTPPTPGPPRPGPPPETPLLPPTMTVRVEQSAFVPLTLTIRAGETVRWVWTDGPRSVTSGPFCTPDGRFDSGNLEPPADFRVTFAEPGEYPYFDYALCGVGMVGRIIVEP